MADDEFGNFEEAQTTSTNQPPSAQAPSNITANTIDVVSSKPAEPGELPSWLLQQSSLLIPTSAQKTNAEPAKSSSSSISPAPGNVSSNSFQTQISPTPLYRQQSSNENVVRQLQEELTRAKEQLIDQQTNYLQLQTQNQQLSHDHNTVMAKIYSDFQNLLKQSLFKQRELLTVEFKEMLNQQTQEQERKTAQLIKDAQRRHETQVSEIFEQKLVEYQEQLIKHNESEYQDIEMKVKLMVNKMFKDEQEKDRTRLKQIVDVMEKDMKQGTEKYVQNYFMSQSEFFKEQIKSGILQERLIHKDLINNKLEKLFRDSEDKRRQANLLFARHVSSLHFFVANAEKQLGLLKEAQLDLFKNKKIIDYYDNKKGSVDDGKLSIQADSKDEDVLLEDDEYTLEMLSKMASVSSLSLSALSTSADDPSLKHQISSQKSSALNDENLLDDLN